MTIDRLYFKCFDWPLKPVLTVDCILAVDAAVAMEHIRMTAPCTGRVMTEVLHSFTVHQ